MKAKINDHEKRIVGLEKTDAIMGERMDNLIKQLSSLSNWIKTLIFLLLGGLFSFFVWYIQSLVM